MRQKQHHSYWKRLIVIAIAVSLSFLGALSSVNAGVGNLDPRFGNGGKVFTHLGYGDRVASLAVQPDGKIIAAGASGSRGIYYASDFALVRYQPDGSLDTSFGSGGKVITDFFGDEDFIKAVALQSDGKIVAAGQARNGTMIYFGLARYNKNGSLDSSFGSGGKVITSFFGYGDQAWAMAIQPDGKIIAAGKSFTGPSEADFGLARYNSDGSLDATFGSGGKVTTDFGAFDMITAIAIQSDGKIVAGGDTYPPDTNLDFALARYNKDGSLDSSFGSGGKVVTDFARLTDFAASLALQPDGKIVLGGDVTTFSSPSRDESGFGLARYNKDGTLDPTFGSGGKVITEGKLIAAHAVVVQPNGKIIAAGQANIGASAGSDFGIARYNPNGTLDSNFGTGGIIATDFTPSDIAFAAALQPDGKLLVAGSSYNTSSGNGFSLARYDVGDISIRTYDTHIQNDTCLFQFDSVGGDYMFTDCASGLTLSGVVRIKVRDCKIVLRDEGDGYDVWARVNLCTHTGKTMIHLSSQDVTYNVNDGDINNPISPCT